VLAEAGDEEPSADYIFKPFAHRPPCTTRSLRECDTPARVLDTSVDLAGWALTINVAESPHHWLSFAQTVVRGIETSNVGLVGPGGISLVVCISVKMNARFG